MIARRRSTLDECGLYYSRVVHYSHKVHENEDGDPLDRKTISVTLGPLYLLHKVADVDEYNWRLNVGDIDQSKWYTAVANTSSEAPLLFGSPHKDLLVCMQNRGGAMTRASTRKQTQVSLEQQDQLISEFAQLAVKNNIRIGAPDEPATVVNQQTATVDVVARQTNITAPDRTNVTLSSSQEQDESKGINDGDMDSPEELDAIGLAIRGNAESRMTIALRNRTATKSLSQCPLRQDES
tara:strand:+ start:2741 stop:3454 length:714 start_codon:yes stop_codon:yes gene_type:complete